MNDSDVVPVASARLPESAHEVSGARVATRVLGSVPRRLELSVGAFGPVVLEWEGHGAAAALRGELVAFSLSRGREAGRLVLDAALARRVVAVALGADAQLGPVLGRLGPGARGVVAGFVAGVLHAAGAPLAVTLAAAPGDGGNAPDVAVVSVAVTAAGGSGWAALELPRGWLDDAARLPADARELAALGVEAAIELGRTTLGAGELSALAPGDAVVFDGQPMLASGATWPTWLIIGAYSANAAVAVDGTLTVTGGFSPSGVRRAGGDRDAVDRGDTTALVALPVNVVAEMARVRLRGDELVRIEAGSVIGLGGARHEAVILRADGVPWAEGELVDVDGELAVRVRRRLR